MAGPLGGDQPHLSLSETESGSTVFVQGRWTTEAFSWYPVPQVSGGRGVSKPLTVDCRELKAIDTTGAAVLQSTLYRMGEPGNFIHVPRQQEALFDRVFTVDGAGAQKPRRINPIAFIGIQTLLLLHQIQGTIALLGEAALVGFRALSAPRRFRLAELMTQLYAVCIMAIGVVSLVTFLIGVVVAYLFSLQAVRYGANIFVVDGVGQAMLRELSPILVAVVLAGRTGSAFTAQIGAMRMNEELDALEMLGLSTYAVVVVPRILALVIAMPLLVFVGDCVGMAGAAFIGYTHLEVTPALFLDRFSRVIPLKAYGIGLSKAPVFGLVVGLIACYMGLTVERNAQSLGLRTTSTVVQSIVAVIIINAVFAIVCATMGW